MVEYNFLRVIRSHLRARPTARRALCTGSMGKLWMSKHTQAVWSEATERKTQQKGSALLKRSLSAFGREELCHELVTQHGRGTKDEFASQPEQWRERQNCDSNQTRQLKELPS